MIREVHLYDYDGDAGALVIVGSRGGASTDPNWARNLRTEPVASVRRGRSQLPFRSREVSDAAERERHWQWVCSEFPLYETYQRRTSRLLPLFVLEPLGEA